MVFDEKVVKPSAETSIYYEMDGKDLKKKKDIYKQKTLDIQLKEKK
ncbi:hypothetical protein [Clostridium cochlearium]|nr:hypothetical protein [Clostridium cochlearium]